MPHHRDGYQTALSGVGALILAVAVLPLLFLGVQGATLLNTEAIEVFTRPDTGWAVLRTLSLGLGVAALCVGIALPLAWLTHSTDLPGRRFFQLGLNLPLAVPSYVSGFIVMATLGHGGWLHELLRPLGVEQMPEIRGGLGATLALLYSYPFALIGLQAALESLDPRLWEAARSLGCSPWRAWRTVVLPQLRAPLLSGGLLIALYTVGDFGAVSLLRYKSLSYIIYLRQDSLSDAYRHEAVFLALMLVVIAVGLVIGSEKAGGEVQQALSAQSHGRPWPVVRLGRWRWPAFGLCCAVFGLGVALPVGLVAWWLARGLALGHTIPLPTAATLITLLLGVVGALLIVAVAAFPALLSRFGDEAASRRVRLTSHVGYALPGIVVALALLSAVTAWAWPLYQTVQLLLIAYLIRFLPLAMHTLSESLMRQSPSLYDAARSLGCTPPRAWWRVILPNSRAALAAGWLAVFIAVIKELPITLLLGPIDFGEGILEDPPRFETLATRIWTLTADEYFSEVAPVVLLLLATATVGLLLRPDTQHRRGAP
ncbi:MAG: iron ABC transporter permease [Myxococcales bacterium]|nr:iron ABC transporter permease [Myxococcales bacterium]